MFLFTLFTLLPDLPGSFSGLNVLDVNHLQPCQVWNSPHNIRIAGSKFAIDTVSQGALQWQVRHGKSRNKHGIGARDISKISSIGQLQAFSFDLFGMMPSQNSQPLSRKMTFESWVPSLGQGDREHQIHQHHTECFLPGARRWGQRGLRTEL